MSTVADVPSSYHGRRSTYNNHGCRCRACTDASTAYSRARRHGTRLGPGAQWVPLPRRPRPKAPRMFAAGPLLDRFGGSPRRFAVSVNASGATVSRALTEGLTVSEADRWAIALGFHPGEVWPEWWAVAS